MSPGRIEVDIITAINHLTEEEQTLCLQDLYGEALTLLTDPTTVLCAVYVVCRTATTSMGHEVGDSTLWKDHQVIARTSSSRRLHAMRVAHGSL